jgi:hypothetical protein
MVGVTKVLGQLDKSAGLIPWAVNMAVDYLSERISNLELTTEDFNIARTLHKQKKNDAAKGGTSFHNVIEHYINTVINGHTFCMDITKEQSDGLMLFQNWVSEHNVKFIAAERPVASLEYCYAGTADIIAEVDGVITLVDLKTTGAIYNTALMQVAAYAEALNETQEPIKVTFNGNDQSWTKTFDPIEQEIKASSVLRISRDGTEIEYKVNKQHDRKYQAFLALLDFFYLEKKRRLKNNKRVK